MTSEDVLSAALALPPQERARVAHELLRSLEEAPDEAVETAWTAEITRRSREIADGAVEPIDLDVAKKQIARRLKERREGRGGSQAPP